jgi:hypothetical protein
VVALSTAGLAAAPADSESEFYGVGSGPLGPFSAFSVSHSKSVLHGAFVWARRALNRPKRRFPARTVGRVADLIHGWLRAGDCVYIHADPAAAGAGGRAEAAGWPALACVAAYQMRYCDAPAAPVLQGLWAGRGVPRDEPRLEQWLRRYQPLLFSAALFKAGRGRSRHWHAPLTSFIRDSPHKSTRLEGMKITSSPVAIKVHKKPQKKAEKGKEKGKRKAAAALDTDDSDSDDGDWFGHTRLP